MPHSQPAPTRTLPVRPSLTQLRKQAKDLLKSYQHGDQASVAEVQRFEESHDPGEFALADAQRVLARAYGFSSWAMLKEHVDGLNVEALCQAVEAGDLATVRALATARPELVNRQRGNESGEGLAIHFAVLHRQAEITRFLMQHDADARAGIWPHRDATTAYTLAVERGFDDIVAIIEQEEENRRRAMSSAGATIDSQTDIIVRAILDDRNADAIQMLQQDLTLVGAANLRGTTPLHAAAWKHSVDMIRWLIEHGAVVDAPDGAGKTPLDYAAIVAGWSDLERPLYFMENARNSPAHFEETVRLLRASGAELTARAAVAVGDVDAIRELHCSGRLKNDIHHLRGGLVSIAVRVNRPDVISLLLDLGLDPDESVMVDEDEARSWGMPLWQASMSGRLDLARLLLSRGADPNGIVYASGDAYGMAVDDDMQALLLESGVHLCVEHISDLETIRAILEGRVKAYSLNVAEPTLIDLAEQMLWSSAGSHPEIVCMCLPYMTRQGDDPWWNYVLVHARSVESMQLILEHGVQPDVRSEGGYTLLQHLATEYAEDQSRVARATLILDAGASLNYRDALLKSTPLGWACRWGRMALVELFLKHGASASEPDSEPWARPVAWARKGGHQQIVDLLVSHGAE